MSTQLNGESDEIARPQYISIASTTAATPIVVTAVSPHGLTTGDAVRVIVVANNLPANAIWIVDVIDGTSFSLRGSVGSGAGGAESISAQFQSLGFNATFAIPADVVDALNAASVGVGFEALADRTVWQSLRTGPMFVVDEAYVSHTDSGQPTSLNSWSSTSGGNTGIFIPVVSTPVLTLYGAKAGDTLEIDFATSMSINAITVQLFRALIAFGSGPYSSLAGTGFVAQLSTINSTSPLVMSSRVILGGPSSPVVNLKIGWGDTGSSTLTLQGDYSFRARLRRTT